MATPPGQVQAFGGTVTNALRFLAGYGIYVGVGADRFVSRLLDAAARRAGSPRAPGPRPPFH